MARDLRLIGIGIERPDERHIPAADRTGPYIAARIASEDLKSRPVHLVQLDEDKALDLIEQLAIAVNILRRGRALDLRRRRDGLLP